MTVAEQSLFIAGRWTSSENGATYQSTNPFTGGIATRAAAATVADVRRAVEAAQHAFGPWAALPPHRRRHFMLATADAVEVRASELSAAITAEMGGPAGWGAYNVKVLCEKLRFAAGAAYQGLTGEAIPSDNPERTMMAIRKPAGVVLSLVPWNAPALLVGASVPAALVLGNTVVIKASEQTPRTHGLVAQCFADAGIPEGVVNLITNAPEVVDTLIAHPHVRRIHFTGSTRVGRIIPAFFGNYSIPMARHMVVSLHADDRHCGLLLSKAPVISGARRRDIPDAAHQYGRSRKCETCRISGPDHRCAPYSGRSRPKTITENENR
ncbi:UNVERIFIED_ORG: aldehyde dehydrogenase family protein [Martelella mediterranea]